MIKYRTEKLYGEGYRDAAPVMAHEIFELNNVDIIDTLIGTILTDDSEPRRALEIINFELRANVPHLHDNKGIFNIIQNYDDHEYEAVLLFENVLKEINNKTGKNIRYVLWLCDSKEDLYNSYYYDGGLTDNDIDEYEDSDVILSDLGRDGKLYGYEELPQPINR